MMREDAPDRIDKSLLVMGIATYLAGQIWINITGSMTKDQIAFDAIHWLMLIGATLIIPFAARLPRRGIALVSGPLLIIGIVLIIGMCVIDFVFWAIPDPDLRYAAGSEMAGTPALWTPFISLAGWVFTPALALSAFIYWRVSKAGVLIAQAGAVLVGALPIWSNPYGYGLILAGFLVCFWAESNSKGAQPS